MSQLDNVSVVIKANVLHDGKAVSHTVIQQGGGRKTVGVILPSTLTFETVQSEVMQIIEGKCKVKHAGQAGLRDYAAGDSFQVPAKSSYEIETLETVHYICHYGT